MSNQVYANGREVSCKAASGKSICAFPDVCFTPPQTPATPPGVPIPYPNTGMASDCADGSTTVKVSSQEVMLKDKSYFKKSSGDEAGSAPKKGVITSVNRGKVYFNAWSMDVKIEGENVVRHLDITTHNHASIPGDTPPVPYQDESASGGDGKPCYVVIGEDQDRVDAAARVLKAKTIRREWPKAITFRPYIKEKHEAISVDFNRKWMNQKMDQGCVILDLGPVGNDSPFYKAESEEITKRGYTKRYRIKMKPIP